MNLYRLDASSGPLCDLLGPRLIRSYRRAMDVAHEHATDHNEVVTVTRISGSGWLKVVATVQPGRGGIGAPLDDSSFVHVDNEGNVLDNAPSYEPTWADYNANPEVFN